MKRAMGLIRTVEATRQNGKWSSGNCASFSSKNEWTITSRMNPDKFIQASRRRVSGRRRDTRTRDGIMKRGNEWDKTPSTLTKSSVLAGELCHMRGKELV